MNIWHDIDKKKIQKDNFSAVIEIPMGSKCKYELDAETGLLHLNRVLYTSTQYPCNYGFIPRTLADDGDALDVLVLCSEPIYPMTLVQVRPIGGMKMIDNGKLDNKIIAVPMGDANYFGINELDQLHPHILDEIMHFYTVYKQLENKINKVEVLYGAEEAQKIVESCINTYNEKFNQ